MTAPKCLHLTLKLHVQMLIVGNNVVDVIITLCRHPSGKLLGAVYELLCAAK
jgi:hypothetical protein